MVERRWCLLQTGLQTRAIQEESILPCHDGRPALNHHFARLPCQVYRQSVRYTWYIRASCLIIVHTSLTNALGEPPRRLLGRT
jgi:hypothetical protein